MPCLVFVGERRSGRAVRLGVTWLDGRLVGRTLHEAPRACGVDPAGAVFLNLFHDDARDPHPCETVLLATRSLAATGATVVALGRRVQAGLQRAGVPYLPLTHPAARGAVRATATNRRLVADLLRSSRPGRPLRAANQPPAPTASPSAAQTSSR